MSEAPSLNNEAARSATGEILDQSTTQALEARQTELAAQRLADPKTGDQTSSEPTPKSAPTVTPDPTATSTTEDGKTLLTQKDPDGKPAATTAPDKYEPFTAPEGYTIAPAVIEAVSPILKELGLDQSGAQKLVDFHVAQMIESSKGRDTAITDMARDWTAKTLADPEIKAYSRDGKSGIEAVKIDLGRAKSVLPADLRAEFDKTMDETGIGNNPAFVRAFWKLSQHVIEGKPVSGKSPSPLGQVDPSKATKPTPAQSMYPGLPSAG